METATITLSSGIVCARKHFETLLKILNLFWLKTLILHHLPSCRMSYMFEKRHRLLNMCLWLMSLLPGCNENHPACFRVALSQYNQHGLNLVEPLTMSKKPRLGRGKRELPVTQQQQVGAWLRYRNSPNALLFLYLNCMLRVRTLCLNFACVAVEEQKCLACTRGLIKTLVCFYTVLTQLALYTGRLQLCIIGDISTYQD